MAENVRINPETHAALAQIAQEENVSLVEALSRAVLAYQRERFLAAVAADFAALSPEERAEDAAEAAVWDATLLDGSEEG
jgi:hypothetical protein